MLGRKKSSRPIARKRQNRSTDHRRSYVYWTPITERPPAKTKSRSASADPLDEPIKQLAEADKSLQPITSMVDAATRSRIHDVCGRYEGELNTRTIARDHAQASFDEWSRSEGERDRRRTHILSNRDHALSLIVQQRAELTNETNDAIAHQKSVLQAHRQAKTAKANLMGISPTAGRLKVHPWWMYPALFVLGYLDYINHKGSMQVLEMSLGYTKALAALTSVGFMLLAHAMGEYVHQIQPSQKGKFVPIIVTAGMIVLVNLGLASWRIDYLQYQSSNLGPSVIAGSVLDALTLAGLNLLIIGGAAFLSWKGTFGHPAQIRQWNTFVRREGRIITAIMKLQAKRWGQEDHFAKRTEATEQKAQTKLDQLDVLHQAKLDRLLGQIRDQEILHKGLRHYQGLIEAEGEHRTSYLTMKYNLSSSSPTAPKGGRATKRSKSSSNGRKKAPLIPLILALMWIGVALNGCERSAGQLTNLKILVDHTGSYRSDQRPFDVEAVMALAQIGSSEDLLLNGCHVQGSVIEDTYLSQTIQSYFPPVNSDELNVITRKKEIKAYADERLGSILEFLFQEGSAPASEVYAPVVKALTDLAQTDADRKVLVIASDMADCTTRLCMHRPKTLKRLQEDPGQVRAELQKVRPFPSDLQGIEVIILSQPLDWAESDQSMIITSFWDDWLTQAGATVQIKRSL